MVQNRTSTVCCTYEFARLLPWHIRWHIRLVKDIDHDSLKPPSACAANVLANITSRPTLKTRHSPLNETFKPFVDKVFTIHSF